MATSVVLAMALVSPAAAQPKTKPALPVTGTAVLELKVLDELMLEFLQEQKVPGATVAVAKDGRLAYSRRIQVCGCREETVCPAQLSSGSPVFPRRLLPPQSVELVEDGKLSFDDKVYDVLKLKADPKSKFDDRWKDITVLHLFQHKGGWDRERSGDPMFKSAEIVKAVGGTALARQDQIIAYIAPATARLRTGKQDRGLELRLLLSSVASSRKRSGKPCGRQYDPRNPVEAAWHPRHATRQDTYDCARGSPLLRQQRIDGEFGVSSLGETGAQPLRCVVSGSNGLATEAGSRPRRTSRSWFRV